MNELIETLRGMADMLDGPQNAGNLVVPAIIGRFYEAADAIERLEAENATLRKQQEQPNEPLTLEELREMDGEPVWLETGEVSIQEAIVGCWEILERVTLYPVKAFWFTRSVRGFTEINYGKTWMAYRRKPEQEK